MTFHLLTPGLRSRPVLAPTCPEVLDTPGPAVVVAEDPTLGNDAPVRLRPADGTWTDLGDEAAEHWVKLGPELRGRLIADPGAPLSVDEFKAATGASAAMITSNWFRSGHPLRFRAAGELRELAEVFGHLGERPPAATP